jgi:spermidine synthase
LGKIVLAVLAASGAIALASEVLWTRTLETLVGNSTYAFSMILVVYQVGIAFGSWLMSLFVGRIKKAPFWLVALQVGMGFWTLIAIFLIDLIRSNIFSESIIAISVYAYLWNCLKAMCILFPLALLSGASFPLATRIIEPGSKDAQGSLIARAYAWNTIGAVFGSLLAGFIIAPFMDFFQSLYFLAFLYGLIALFAYFFINQGDFQAQLKKPASLGLCGLLVLLICVGAYQISGESHFVKRFQARFPYRQVVFHKPGLQGITTVAKQRTRPLANRLLVNGMGMTVKITDTKMMAHLPMLTHPNPENTLVICFGMGTTFRSAISHNGKVTAVELIKEVYEAFPFFFDDANRVKAYPQGKLITNDGRIFLKLTQDRFDVITIDPPPPIDAAGVTNLYSKDFLELARSRLKDGGIMAHWIPLPGSLAGVDDSYSFRMLLATFKEVYPFSYIMPAWNNVGVHVLGSIKPIEFSKEKIKGKLEITSVAQDIFEWEVIPLDYFDKIVPLELPGYQGLIVTDDHPFLEFNLLRYLRRGTRKSSPLTAW